MTIGGFFKLYSVAVVIFFGDHVAKFKNIGIATRFNSFLRLRVIKHISGLVVVERLGNRRDLNHEYEY